jgi:2-C-methyl-D-erythritol 2,4-cyclodiphosphate synthase
VNVDSTLILAAPKIGPHADAIRRHVAKLMSISPANIGIKAKTPEGMGTENAAIAHAIVLLEEAKAKYRPRNTRSDRKVTRR